MNLENICRMIERAGESELSEIAQAVVRRYHALFEEEEVVILSLPKNDPKERRRIIDAVLKMERI